MTEKYGEIPPIGAVVYFEDLEIKVVKATKQKVLKLRSRILSENEIEEREKSED